MPKFLFLILLLTGSAVLADAQEKRIAELQKACKALDQALISKSEKDLQLCLHPKLSLGHSNGLIENKTELLDHLRSGYLQYVQIESLDTPIIHTYKKLATVRRDLSVKGALKNQNFEVKLRVLETWLWHRSVWQLLNRQSTKLN